MKKHLLILAFLLFSIFVNAQGIKFENLNWKETLALAKKENKMVYVDFFTTWCGPCKIMEQKFFKDEEVGNFYNQNFINITLDAEKGEGIVLAKKYNIDAYPTNIFIDANAEQIVYKTTGCPMEKEGFMGNGVLALDEYKDPMKLEDYNKKYLSKKFDEPFLKNYLTKNNRHDINNDKIFDEYLDRYGMRFDDSAKIFMIQQYGISGFSKWSLALNKKYNSTPFVDNYLSQLLKISTYKAVEMAKNDKDDAKMNYASDLMKNHYPNGYEYMYNAWVEYYENNKNTKKLKSIYTEYGNYFLKIDSIELAKRDSSTFIEIKESLRSQFAFYGVKEEDLDSQINKYFIENPWRKYASTGMVATNLNKTAWEIYEKFPSDKSLLALATKASLKSMKLTENDSYSWCNFADTYAHILYISGKKDEALQLEELVLNKAIENKREDLLDFKDFIEELKK